MTKLLDDALAAARNLPPDDQDNIARVVLRLAGTDEEPPVALSTAERGTIATIRRMAVLPYPYLIFYEAKEAEIIIHAIRHSARDPSVMPGARA
jgi:plasmid stabilization system protein ParE